MIKLPPKVRLAIGLLYELLGIGRKNGWWQQGQGLPKSGSDLPNVSKFRRSERKP